MLASTAPEVFPLSVLRVDAVIEVSFKVTASFPSPDIPAYE